ncbi:MAG: hypothetical protein GWP08_19805, partial [Nitrospiraceae bacterium]|nr:hypothetical protein [Nitrospiraceae bacterium]
MSATTSTKYDYFLEIRNEACDRILHQSKLPSALKLLEHASFEAHCSGLTDDEMGPSERRLIPVWADRENSPYVKKLEVRFESTGGEPIYRKEYGVAPFLPSAQAVAQVLVTQGMLKPGERFNFLISARADGAPEGPAQLERRSKFKTRLERAGFPFVDCCVAEIVHGARPPQDACFDVHVARHVLNDILRQVGVAEQKEQAGFLLGRLCRDTQTGRVAAVVEAQVQATAAVEPTCTSFTLSPSTFDEARHVLETRNRPGEVILGWQHSHTWCGKCEKRSECQSSTVFWSLDDEAVHESAFPQPYNIGLVVGLDHKQEGSPYSFKMFGWQDGLIRERGFHVLDQGE